MDRTSPRLRIRVALLAVLLGGTLALAACSSGSSPAAPTASASPPPASAAPTASAAQTVSSVSDPRLGAHLAGDGGRTLYVLTSDGAGTSTCSASCAASWPPFTLAPGGTAVPGSGVTGKIAQITRADGGVQVTYMDAPLYYYSGDAKAGDVNGQGIGGVWFVAATAGGPGASGGASPSTSKGDGY